MSTTTTTSATATFHDLQIGPGTLDAIAAMGYETPSPIQGLAIPPFLAGRDLIAQARTGTGKTASFGIPIVERLRNGAAHGVAALVLAPTRELAIQVAEELDLLSKGSPLRVATVYGGVGYGKQVQELAQRAPLIAVATPGRLIDLLQQGLVQLGGVRILVLDEADRMLDMGFLPDVERILRALPAQRQTGLYSATMPDPIRRLASRFLKDPATVRAEPGPVATPTAEQFVLEAAKDRKAPTLLALLQKEMPERAIVFTRTKHLARRLAENLHKAGWAAVPLQGNMSQNQRERALAAFRAGEARILVATDVAARGLDVPEVSHVINFDLPDEPEAYVHRIGRTARMGRTGRAFTFVQPDEARDWKAVERTAGVPVQRMGLGPLPAVPAPGPDAGRAAIEFRGHAPGQPGRGAPRGHQARHDGRRHGGGRRSHRSGGPRRSSPPRRW